NAPGSHIAIEHGFTGFNLTFTQRESSALSAVAFAAAQIVKGSAAAAIAGGVEEINEMTFSVLDRIGALAHRRGELDECPRPFDRDRNGMGVGEGAAMFRLMRDENVVEPRWGYLSGFAIARDPSASISDWGSGADHVVRAMRGALDDAGVELGEIDAIWASANGTRRGDRLEATAIDRLFAGMEIPPVVATKGYFGEYAAAGALHLASALVALREQRLFASLGFRHPDAGARFAPTTRDEQRSLRHLLINSLSAGGGIVSAVLSRP
ncbi:MAG TPA: beta-ketoacyl synthase N-terminal-like domain-containing protein, partial [Thermoanaerobaculia bacterium]|nr:beta-ketoacyl synthase N-terminal-like domain-containing protein [Thermoanaerobaculia bacterium]